MELNGIDRGAKRIQRTTETEVNRPADQRLPNGQYLVGSCCHETEAFAAGRRQLLLGPRGEVTTSQQIFCSLGK